jgi:hypothetical protein
MQGVIDLEIARMLAGPTMPRETEIRERVEETSHRPWAAGHRFRDNVRNKVFAVKQHRRSLPKRRNKTSGHQQHPITFYYSLCAVLILQWNHSELGNSAGAPEGRAL